MNDHWFKRAYRPVALLVIAILCVAQMGAVPLQQTATPRLVRIDAGSEAELSALSSLGIPVYARMGAPGGGLVVVAEATAQQQAALTAAGITVTTLADDAQAGELYLLYGLPEDLQAAESQAALLAKAGRQAVARATEEQIATLESQGIGALRLFAEVLPAVAPQPSAQAAVLAPNITYSPVVQGMVNAIQQSTLSTYIAQLSGEQNAIVGGVPRDIESRFTMNEQQINWATRFAYEHFAALGLPVTYDYFEMPYGGNWYQKRNVVAQQTGLTEPNRIVLLTAHIDSFSYASSSVDAPGADDNATGSAAVLAIADVLSNYSFGFTLRYVLFTGEEQGLYGSKAYAADRRALGENIEGVLNLDMLGYNTPGSPPQIELHTRPGNAGDLYFANLFSQAVSAYGQPLNPVILQDSLSFSDHSPFWTQGYPAILAIEDWADHTPYYHSTGDTLASLNMPYYTAFVKSSIASFAHMGSLLDGGISGVVTNSSNGSPLSNVRVSIFTAGNPLNLLTDVNGAFGVNLLAGTYSARFMAENFRSMNVSSIPVNGYQITILNRALQPCNTIAGLSMNPANVVAEAGQPVEFEAQVSGGQTPVTYSWDFGDGSSATGAQVEHTFASPGAYPVRLTANNTCDYPVVSGSLALIDVEAIYLPLVSR